MDRIRIAFVLETGLGHRTMFRLFRSVVEEDPSIDAVWIPVEFSSNDILAKVPGLRNDFVARAGWTAWQALRSASRRARLDAVAFHTQMVAVFCSRMMQKVPSIVRLDATPSQFAAMGAHYGLSDPARTSLRERIRERWYRQVFMNARCVVGMCRWAAEGVEREYGVPRERVRVSYPGVNLEAWHPVTKRDDGPIRLLFVGGDFVRKGGALLLRWMASEGHQHCVLDVVTSAEIAPTEGVTVHRGLDPNDGQLVHLYQSADLFVLPTRADCTSLAIIEAMASGTPVLATQIGGTEELLGGSDEAGVTIAPDSYEALAGALRSLTRDRPRLRVMGEAARARAERLFDGPSNVRKELALLRQLARDEALAPMQIESAPVF